jgi:hypothetical protein
VQHADEAGIRLGRKHVHRRRIHPVRATEEAQSILTRLTRESATSARILLRRALKSESLTGIMVRPEEESVALVLATSGIILLEEKTEGDAAVYHWRPYRARIADGRRDEVSVCLGKLNPDEARAALILEISGIPELAGEARLLALLPSGAPLRVPSESGTKTAVWSVYDASLRAAAGWWQARLTGSPLSARELAAKKLGWSKAWTPARIAAFERLIKMKFEDALETMEPEVRLRGPLSWTSESTIIDAHAARPWVAIPARSALQYGKLQHSQAQGVLVIENLDTFEAICRHSRVPDTWLCLWGHGYVNNSLVALVKAVNKLTACWADLDAHGVAIVGDLQRRTRFPISPVFMDASLHDEWALLPQDKDQSKLAAELAANGHPDLRALADRVATTQRGREQETMHHLIPSLLSRLSELAS